MPVTEIIGNVVAQSTQLWFCKAIVLLLFLLSLLLFPFLARCFRHEENVQATLQYLPIFRVLILDNVVDFLAHKRLLILTLLTRIEIASRGTQIPENFNFILTVPSRLTLQIILK
jgi:hypothetical protein